MSRFSNGFWFVGCSVPIAPNVCPRRGLARVAVWGMDKMLKDSAVLVYLVSLLGVSTPTHRLQFTGMSRP
jgi:hypothetical protein